MTDQPFSSVHSSIAQHWNQHSKVEKKGPVSRWWKSKIIWQHINKNYYDIDSSEKFAFHNFVEARISSCEAIHALSIGCGEAHKEIRLLQKGIVSSFDLFDLSSERLSKARQSAKDLNLSSRINFNNSDFLSQFPRKKYDLIYWHAALHHMLDVPEAVSWCKDSLREGGFFVFNEYVGPNRFQWPEDDLEIINDIRHTIPQSIMKRAKNNGVKVKKLKRPPSLQRMIKTDPSEAADSERILTSIQRSFASVDMLRLGGIVYMAALGDVVTYVQTPQEIAWLNACLQLDKVLARMDRFYFASGICK